MAGGRSAQGADTRRARRWFWTLTASAVLAMGGLYRGLHSAPGTGAATLVAVGSMVAGPRTVQAARILTALAGPPRIPR